MLNHFNYCHRILIECKFELLKFFLKVRSVLIMAPVGMLGRLLIWWLGDFFGGCGGLPGRQ